MTAKNEGKKRKREILEIYEAGGLRGLLRFREKEKRRAGFTGLPESGALRLSLLAAIAAFYIDRIRFLWFSL